MNEEGSRTNDLRKGKSEGAVLRPGYLSRIELSAEPTRIPASGYDILARVVGILDDLRAKCSGHEATSWSGINECVRDERDSEGESCQQHRGAIATVCAVGHSSKWGMCWNWRDRM